MAEANLPGLRIYLDNEDAQGQTIHQPQLVERTLVLIVDCCAKLVTELDDALDQISKEVEVALYAGLTISGKNIPCYYQGMQFADEQADKPVGVKSLRFAIQFTAMSNAPDVLI